MSGNQPEIVCGEPMVMGIEILSPISSAAGSPTLFITQPLLTGRVFASSAVMIGAEFILFIAERYFRIRSIPILDLKNDRTVQMPLSELQDFLRWMANGSGSAPNLSTTTDGSNVTGRNLTGSNFTPGDRGFPTPESPEAPIIVALYVLANYSNKLYTPYVLLTVPLFTFPGLRGALPLLITGLLATIFVRAVVPPESTGSKPLVKPGSIINSNNPLTFTPNDLLQLLTKFGKHFAK